MEDQKVEYKFFRTSLEFVVSVCVLLLSFFVWYSSGLEVSSIVSHDQSFNGFIFSIITHALHKKYMFLICNAILAFLAKTSSSSTTISSSPPNFTLHLPPSSLQDTDAQSSQDYASLLVEEEDAAEAEEGDDSSCKEMEEGKREALLVDEEEEEEEGSNEAFNDDEEAEEGEVGTALMAMNEELVNTEELNRRFEEFIRKTKQEIRIEAQRQLIAV